LKFWPKKLETYKIKPLILNNYFTTESDESENGPLTYGPGPMVNPRIDPTVRFNQTCTMMISYSKMVGILQIGQILRWKIKHPIWRMISTVEVV